MKIPDRSNSLNTRIHPANCKSNRGTPKRHFFSGAIHDNMWSLIALYVFLCSGVVFSDVCDSTTYCTIMTWYSWGGCEGKCGTQTFQIRKRFVCYEAAKIPNPTREKVIKFCNISLSTSFEERRACKYCLYGLYNATTQSCEICSKFSTIFPIIKYKSLYMYLGLKRNQRKKCIMLHDYFLIYMNLIMPQNNYSIILHCKTPWVHNIPLFIFSSLW